MRDPSPPPTADPDGRAFGAPPPGRPRAGRFLLALSAIAAIPAAVLAARALWAPPGTGLEKFEFDYYGGGKTVIIGVITPESFSIHQWSSYPTDFTIEGETPAPAWDGVERLFRDGKRGTSPNGHFEAAFTSRSGRKVEASFEPEGEHNGLFEIVDFCMAQAKKYHDDDTPLR